MTVRTGLFSFYMDNISPEVVSAQRKVVESCRPDHVSFHQLLISDVHRLMTTELHSDALDGAVLVSSYDIYIFLDIDCIPLHQQALPRLVDAAARGTLIGCAQHANHKDNNGHIYAGPFCMAFSRDLWERLGRPSFRETLRGDVGEEITYQCEERGQPLELLWPTRVDEPLWRLSGDVMFGRGTEYDDAFYHQFDSRFNIHTDRFLRRCDQVLLPHSDETDG